MKLPTTAQLQNWFAPIFGLIDSAGEPIIIRENIGSGQWTSHPAVNGKPNAIKVEDIITGSLARQGDFKIIIRSNVFPVARRLENKDRVTFRGRDWAVIDDDANQYSIGGVCYARVLHVRG